MNSGNTTQDVLEIGEFIGAGTYGVVFRCRYNTRKAAIKKFRLHQHTTDQAKIIEQEISLLKHLRYRHIIQYYGVYHQDNKISLVTDFAEGGSLRQAIEDSRVAGWHTKSRIAQEIADGLTYIHHEGIIHRDLRSDNVLLSGLMEVKLCDFGLAVVKTSSGGHSTEVMRGTFRWLAPELVVAKRPRYSNKSDMYALGMVMWEMAAMCTVPFKAMSNNLAVAQAVHGGQREQLPKETPVIYQHWVDLCWKQDPSERPDAHEMIIVDDALSRGQGTDLAGTSWPALAHDIHELSIIPEMSPVVTPAPAEATAVQPRMEFVSLSRKAVLNDVDAQVSLAEMYETGNGGVPKDNEKAFTWYLRAAQLGNLDAMDRVSDMYAEGRGTEQSDDEAARWNKQATEQRTSKQNGGVHIASNGALQSAEQDPDDKSWFLTTSRKRLAAMKSSLGSVMNVRDTNQDRVQARAEIQAAEGGDARAQFNIGLMYETGRVVEQSDIEAFRWYTKAASQGNSNAQFNLGWMYKIGQGVEQSDVEAAKWFTKAARQGNPDAQHNLGVMSSNGQGVEQSDVEAVKWFTKAASQESPNGQYCLGVMYLEGRGVEQSDVEAVKWYTKAASQGNPDAQYNLGVMYLEGRGVEKSDVRAVKWFTKAASQGISDAQNSLGAMYKNGQGVEQSDVKAVKWFTKAASQGCPQAQCTLGYMYLNGRDVKQSDVEAFKWFTKAASQGNPKAQFNLGLMYKTGRGVEQSDVEAVKWYTKAASQGGPKAQVNLGSMYENGQGVEQSDVEAVKWYTKAASQGNSNAQFNLGWMYVNGRGVEQSDVEAVKWYTKAAREGDLDAQCNLGWMYCYGRGVEESDIEAVKWYTKSASQGNPDAQYYLGVMYRNGHGVKQSEAKARKWLTKAARQGNLKARYSLSVTGITPFAYLIGPS
ncbi:hypothetical protein DFQ27_007968 [Actinomortierella ambigua]|uniref:Protein kinase domain-containing protein n=1 Tax=Actinomortierella ambigua TaxID=1343610 RepID=A0A9P6UBH5_9FUNG|nr:hypothetical protein DFQ27_007968 [Actinomortierella ambigua]